MFLTKKDVREAVREELEKGEVLDIYKQMSMVLNSAMRALEQCEDTLLTMRKLLTDIIDKSENK